MVSSRLARTLYAVKVEPEVFCEPRSLAGFYAGHQFAGGSDGVRPASLTREPYEGIAAMVIISRGLRCRRTDGARPAPYRTHLSCIAATGVTATCHQIPTRLRTRRPRS